MTTPKKSTASSKGKGSAKGTQKGMQSPKFKARQQSKKKR